MGKKALLTIVAIAVLLVSRGALISVSKGSNDIQTWKIYGEYVSRYGVLAAYDRFRTLGPVESIFNHGPIAAAIGSFALDNRFLFGSFSRSFRMLCLLGSVATLIVIGVMGSRPLAGLLFYLLSPVSLLIEGFHGNTDPVAAGLLMIGVLVGLRPSGDLLRGFCFGLAILAKPIAIIAVIPLVAVAWREGTLFRTALGCGFGVFPLFVTHILEPQSVPNMWAYRSSPEPWGSRLLPRSWEPLRSSSLICLALPCVYALCVARGWFKASLPGALAVSWLLFLLFVPGLGVQYFIYPLAPLLIAAPMLGGVYGIFVGCFLTAVYVTFLRFGMDGSVIMPLATLHQPMKGFPHLVLAAKLAWINLLLLTCQLMRQQYQGSQKNNRRSPADSDALICEERSGGPSELSCSL